MIDVWAFLDVQKATLPTYVAADPSRVPPPTLDKIDSTFMASMMEMKQHFGTLVSTVNQLMTKVNGLQNSVRTATVERPVLPSTASDFIIAVYWRQCSRS